MARRGARHILRPEGADAEARALRGVQADAQADARGFPRADAAHHRAVQSHGLSRFFARRRRGRRLYSVDREIMRRLWLGCKNTLGRQRSVSGDRRRNLRHPSVARRDGLHALRRRELPRKVRLRAAVYGGLPRAARGLRRQHSRRAGHRGEDGARPRRQIRTARGYLRKPRKRSEGAARQARSGTRGGLHEPHPRRSAGDGARAGGGADAEGAGYERAVRALHAARA